jgi:dienelactone hydrolase
VSDIGRRLTKALAGRYDVERELGHGGMATVHLARDVRHGRTVAIKVLRPELAQAVGSERFLREINIAAQLQSPHILPMLESGEADGLLYYVMPYVEGDSLRGLLARHGTLAPSEAMRLLRDIVDGVAHAHRHHVVHRDIKPDNVMVADRHAILMDLGIAKAMSDLTSTIDLTSVGISLGTPAYMAPEQAAADPAIDHRADIYSLGVLAYEMLSGKPPFTGTPQAVLAAHITSAPKSLGDVRPEVPPAIARIVTKCLEKDPGRRYQNADELLADLESLVTPLGLSPANLSASHHRTVRLGVVGVAVVILGLLALDRYRDDRWVHQVAAPELRRLAQANEADSAFVLALRIEEAARGDTTLQALWPAFSRRMVIESDPPGVRVHRAPMTDTSAWHFVGTTPTDSVRVPSAVGLFRFEKAGYQTSYSTFGNPQGWIDAGYLAPLRPSLDPDDATLEGMVRVPGGLSRAFLVGTDAATPLTLGDYRIGRFEVTNSQYKAFVEAGGYADRRWWEHPFLDGDGRPLTFEAAMARFTDRTGRPGPAVWEAGTFPAGQGDTPVGGVSWHEAAAFAKFAGKSLPTIYHWARAAGIVNARYIVPQSNLDGNGPLPVGTLRGATVAGVSDMAGNVREWSANDAGRGLRFILGGGWRDPRYAFVDAYAQPPMDRSEINGIRLALYDGADSSIAVAALPIPRAFTDFSRERPVSNAVFAGYLPQFDYDPTSLDAVVEARDSTPEDWVMEQVSFNAAYGDERMSAWLYLPKTARPPYQAVVIYPGSNAIGSAAFDGSLPSVMSFLPAGGRALIYPIYQSTHERSDSLRSDLANQSIYWRDHMVMWVKDYRRTLDYLSSRPDMDSTKFAYFGFSWGGYMGGIVPAVEPRVKASVLYVAGLTMERGRPEVEPINYLPRITSPVLMLNGRYDFFFPVETAQKPFFDFLGTPAEHKKWIVYEGGHDVPRTDLIRESLAWLDKYLGPVR